MRFDQRVVTELPPEQLWNSEGFVLAHEIVELPEADIRNLLKGGRVRFVVGNLGEPFRWVPPNDCYDFWRSEVKLNLLEQFEGLMVDDFPNG